MANPDLHTYRPFQPYPLPHDMGNLVRQKYAHQMHVATPGLAGTGDHIPLEGWALLDAIASTESPGYNVRYGGATFDDLSDHPRIGKMIVSGPNKGRLPSTAAGRYQFTKTTWDGEVQPALNLPDFSPKSQDIAAWWLANKEYRNQTKGRDLLSDLRSGDPEIMAGVGTALKGRWTSLPGGIETTTNTNKFTRVFNRAYEKRAGHPIPPLGIDGPLNPDANVRSQGWEQLRRRAPIPRPRNMRPGSTLGPGDTMPPLPRGRPQNAPTGWEGMTPLPKPRPLDNPLRRQTLTGGGGGDIMAGAMRDRLTRGPVPGLNLPRVRPRNFDPVGGDPLDRDNDYNRRWRNNLPPRPPIQPTTMQVSQIMKGAQGQNRIPSGGGRDRLRPPGPIPSPGMIPGLGAIPGLGGMRPPQPPVAGTVQMPNNVTPNLLPVPGHNGPSPGSFAPPPLPSLPQPGQQAPMPMPTGFRPRPPLPQPAVPPGAFPPGFGGTPNAGDFPADPLTQQMIQQGNSPGAKFLGGINSGKRPLLAAIMQRLTARRAPNAPAQGGGLLSGLIGNMLTGGTTRSARRGLSAVPGAGDTRERRRDLYDHYRSMGMTPPGGEGGNRYQAADGTRRIDIPDPRSVGGWTNMSDSRRRR